MAGIPFDLLEKVSTRATAGAAPALVVMQKQLANKRSTVESILDSQQQNLSQEFVRAWRKAIREGVVPLGVDAPSRAFADFWEKSAALAAAEAKMDDALAKELARARYALMASAPSILSRYLVFAAKGIKDLLLEMREKRPGEGVNLPPRRTKERARERRLLLYLQRVCAKNDTFSEFGPHAWGTIQEGVRALSLGPAPGIAQREAFLERWTALGVAAAVNADAEARAELAPRLHPDGRIEGGNFIFADTGATEPLDRQTLAVLHACDGATPAHLLGIDMEILADLHRQNLIRWELEVPALDPRAFDQLIAQIAHWRYGAARTRWLERLQPIVALPKKFAAITDTDARIKIIDEATDRLEELGSRKTASRFLYSATNPIGEECFRECHFSIGEELIDEVAVEAAPWIDLWRDNYAYVASRVAAGLRGLFRQMPGHEEAVPLPAFLRHCAEAKMALTGPGLVVLAHFAFQEVRVKFREIFSQRGALVEFELSAEDGLFVRRNFEFPRFDEYTYPSADLQLSASSVAAVDRGEYQWVLAELHPPVALLHHGFYWSCPEKDVLTAALSKTAFGRPSPHFGIFVADFTAATTVRIFDALPDLSIFVAPQRAHPAWRSVPPAEVEVFVDKSSGDVGLQRSGSGEYLGSLARNWIIPLGFHPFSFSLGKNTPRLRCGNVIVQRRAWTVALDELGAGNFTGISRDLVIAVERLRARRGLPRHIYIRPTEAALRRSGAEGRDKDTKPVYIDLESYLFLEIFHRWLVKAGELEVTEMLPDPEHLLWQEKDGRRTFELRTQIVPR
ncbi:MAG TPA: hypothetical protein VGI85_08275 [Chthoniobacterales bacterium]|jgi:hypothetical protein